MDSEVWQFKLLLDLVNSAVNAIRLSLVDIPLFPYLFRKFIRDRDFSIAPLRLCVVLNYPFFVAVYYLCFIDGYSILVR